jgi:signal transduction histidine kinase
MKIGLHGKILIAFLSFALATATVLFVFISRGSTEFYMDQFYGQVNEVFTEPEFKATMEDAVKEGANLISDVIATYAGELGLDNKNRVYYILTRHGEPLATMNDVPASVKVTPNITSAMLGKVGDTALLTDDFMDMAIPIGDYIVYIVDNKANVKAQSAATRTIFLQSVAVAMLIAVFLGFMLSKQLVMPLQRLARAAQKIASGVFPEKLAVTTRDEAGVLIQVFNEMSEHLQQEDQTRRDFVANVSHELRTPITSVRSYAETLQDAGDTLDAETRDHFQSVILNESDRMTRLVQDLLTLSKIDSGEMSLLMEPFDFTASVRSVYEAMSLDATKRGLHMTLKPLGVPVKLTGDKDRLEQVLINLISNAVRYTPDGGKITVSAGTDTRRGEVWAAVSDTGIGIPKEDIPKLFDRFYRVDKARSRAKGGSGLGLSIAHEIVDRHGGRIEIESDVGVGTTMTVRLPITNDK